VGESGQSDRTHGRRFHTALDGRVSWYCVPERASAAPPEPPCLVCEGWGAYCDKHRPAPERLPQETDG